MRQYVVPALVEVMKVGVFFAAGAALVWGMLLVK
jgi:hypothetical protein